MQRPNTWACFGIPMSHVECHLSLSNQMRTKNHSGAQALRVYSIVVSTSLDRITRSEQQYTSIWKQTKGDIQSYSLGITSYSLWAISHKHYNSFITDINKLLCFEFGRTTVSVELVVVPFLSMSCNWSFPLQFRLWS